MEIVGGAYASLKNKKIFCSCKSQSQMRKECQSKSAKKDFMKSGDMKSHGEVSLENCNNFHMHCMNNKTTRFGGVCSYATSSAIKLTKSRSNIYSKISCAEHWTQ